MNTIKKNSFPFQAIYSQAKQELSGNYLKNSYKSFVGMCLSPQHVLTHIMQYLFRAKFCTPIVCFQPTYDSPPPFFLLVFLFNLVLGQTELRGTIFKNRYKSFVAMYLSPLLVLRNIRHCLTFFSTTFFENNFFQLL